MGHTLVAWSPTVKANSGSGQGEADDAVVVGRAVAHQLSRDRTARRRVSDLAAQLQIGDHREDP